VKILPRDVLASGVRFSVIHDGVEVGRAYLYLLKNDLHETPFGFLEDVFVEEGHRGSGIASALLSQVIHTARLRGCYKIVATSRHSRERVHSLYRSLGFKEYGHEFRMDLTT
jgi:GNAT superfamily N-acetyltransferase